MAATVTFPLPPTSVKYRATPFKELDLVQLPYPDEFVQQIIVFQIIGECRCVRSCAIGARYIKGGANVVVR